MMELNDLQHAVEMAKRAQEIKDNPVWKEMTDEAEQGLIDKLIEAHGDAEACQTVALMAVAIDLFRGRLEEAIEGGEVARHELNAIMRERDDE